MPIIRKATVNDAESVRRMQAESWRDTYPSEENGVSKEWVEETTRKWFEPLDEKIAESQAIFQNIIDHPEIHFYRVAEKDGRIVGFVHGRIVKENNETIGNATAIYIDKKFHGTGLAQRMSAQRDDFFREHGVRKITTTVASYNARSMRFHEKVGYHKIAGTERKEFGIVPVTDMERNVGDNEPERLSA